MHRGATIGDLEKRIKYLAEQNGASVDVRAARMSLAEHVLAKDITSYIQLEDWEIRRIRDFAFGDGMIPWMKECYGSSERLVE